MGYRLLKEGTRSGMATAPGGVPALSFLSHTVVDTPASVCCRPTMVSAQPPSLTGTLAPSETKEELRLRREGDRGARGTVGGTNATAAREEGDMRTMPPLVGVMTAAAPTDRWVMLALAGAVRADTTTRTTDAGMTGRVTDKLDTHAEATYTVRELKEMYEGTSLPKGKSSYPDAQKQAVVGWFDAHAPATGLKSLRLHTLLITPSSATSTR